MDTPRRVKKTCLCGCGSLVLGTFKQGHDSKAVWQRVRRDFGSTKAFIEWYDAQRPTSP